MIKVDLNCDLGESFGAYTIGRDSDVLPIISSANVACGWHAGDAVTMEKTVKMAKAAGTEVGAHPGYPDLEGFGRRKMVISPAEAKAYIKYQVGALMAFAKAEGITLQHVKPHGAFYNNAAVDYKLALGICEGIKEVRPDLILLGLANSELIRAAKDIGLKSASEVFADRAYMDDGTLVPRKQPGAVLHDEEEAIRRTVRMVKEGCVTTISGKEISIQADSVCVHGDNEKALEFSAGIRRALTQEGIEIASLRSFI